MDFWKVCWDILSHCSFSLEMWYMHLAVSILETAQSLAVVSQVLRVSGHRLAAVLPVLWVCGRLIEASAPNAVVGASSSVEYAHYSEEFALGLSESLQGLGLSSNVRLAWISLLSASSPGECAQYFSAIALNFSVIAMSFSAIALNFSVIAMSFSECLRNLAASACDCVKAMYIPHVQQRLLCHLFVVRRAQHHEQQHLGFLQFLKVLQQRLCVHN